MAFWSSAATPYSPRPHFPLDHVVDPTGAGDTFASGFIGYIAATGDKTPDGYRRAAVLGSVMGSFCVQDFSVDKVLTLSMQDIEDRSAPSLNSPPSLHCKTAIHFLTAYQNNPGNHEEDRLTTETNKGHIADPSLASDGVRRIHWAAREMPVLHQIRERFAKEKPLTGLRIAACLHVTSETANLLLALQDGGAETAICASNPLSTQDRCSSRASSRVRHTHLRHQRRGQRTYYSHINSALDTKPHITMDDGADLVATLPPTAPMHSTGSSAAQKRPQQASSAFAVLPKRASSSTQSSPSTTPTRSTSSTTSTAQARAPSTASPEPPTSSGRARRWSSPATAGADAASHFALAAWARRQS